MTRHLSREEQVATLDGALDAARVSHVDVCAVCRDEIEALRAVLATVAAAKDVPEPSPLFWDHFSSRVRRATLAEPEAAPAASGFGWRSWVVLASAMIALAVTVTVRQLAVPVPATHEIALSPARATEIPQSAPQHEGDAGPWTEVVQVASRLSADDVGGLLPSSFEPSPLVEDLSPAERAAFVRLLNAEMGKNQ